MVTITNKQDERQYEQGFVSRDLTRNYVLNKFLEVWILMYQLELGLLYITETKVQWLKQKVIFFNLTKSGNSTSTAGTASHKVHSSFHLWLVLYLAYVFFFFLSSIKMVTKMAIPLLGSISTDKSKGGCISAETGLFYQFNGFIGNPTQYIYIKLHRTMSHT